MLMNTLLNLMMINIFVVLVHEAGFFKTLGTVINERWKFYHLPYVFKCGLCQTFWLSIIYVIIAGPFTIPGICLCVVNASLTRVTQPLCRLVENILLKLIELLNMWLKIQ